MSGVLEGTSPAAYEVPVTLKSGEQPLGSTTLAPELARFRSAKLYSTRRPVTFSSESATRLGYFSQSSSPWPQAIESPTTSMRMGLHPVLTRPVHAGPVAPDES